MLVVLSLSATFWQRACSWHPERCGTDLSFTFISSTTWADVLSKICCRCGNAVGILLSRPASQGVCRSCDEDSLIGSYAEKFSSKHHIVSPPQRTSSWWMCFPVSMPRCTHGTESGQMQMVANSQLFSHREEIPITRPALRC
jgi:hypothetical protein